MLLAAAVDHLRQLIAARSRLLQIVAIVPLVLVVREPRRELFATFENLAGYQRVSMMGHYLREALPQNAVILTYLQSGAAAYYTGLPIVRLDALGPEWLDRLITDLWDAGRRPVFLIDDAMESQSFRERYENSRYRHARLAAARRVLERHGNALHGSRRSGRLPERRDLSDRHPQDADRSHRIRLRPRQPR